MACVKRVMLAFVAFRETGKPVFLAQRTERFPAPRDDLMHVGLMPYVEDDRVLRAVKRAVHRDGEFNRAEVGCEMPAAFRNVFDQILPYLRRERGQFSHAQALEILNGVDFIEYRVTVHVYIALPVSVYFTFFLSPYNRKV